MNVRKVSENSESRTPFSILSDDSGRGTTWALLLCLGTLVWYMKVGQPYLAAQITPFHHLLVLATLAVAVLFTVGCCIHMILIGDKTAGQLRRDLRRQASELETFVQDAQKRIRDYESVALRNVRTIRPVCLNSLGTNRRIINALDRRVVEVKQLLHSRNQIDLIDAHELLNRDLEIVENCVDTLINADPVEPIEPNKWLATIENNFKEIDTDLQRLAA